MKETARLPKFGSAPPAIGMKVGRYANSGGIIAALCALGRAVREALIRCQQAHDRSRLHVLLEGLAVLVADRGESAEAARLLSAADALRAGVGKPRTPD